MKRILIAAAMLLGVFCSCEKAEQKDPSPVKNEGNGILKVSMAYEKSPAAKATTDYTTVLDAEKTEKKVSVYVFDKSSGLLNVSQELTKTTDQFEVTVPAGEKTVYAVVNGPVLPDLTSLDEFKAIQDNLSDTDIATDGLTMIGSADCTVSANAPATADITVRRMVARVVIDGIVNRLPAQYGKMTIEAIYLGNANSVQNFDGTVSGMVNPLGYADNAKSQPIGKDGVTGACDNYMYKAPAADVKVNATYDVKNHLYCQPNRTTTPTCVFILATIGSGKYYYRIPLDGGLDPNYTYSVSATVNNLGTQNPDDDFIKGNIVATITVAGWSAGDDYNAEF